MTKQSETGKLGEDLACRYIENKGYKILERNYRKPWGELDIICVDPRKMLVFAEVKTVSGEDPRISGEEQMTKSKLGKFKRAAEIYANQNPTRVGGGGWRIDLLAINIIGDKAKIKHYENI